MLIDLKELIYKQPPKNGKFYLIAIDGRAGAGKSSLATLVKVLVPEFVYLNGDDYFEPIKDKVVWGAFNDKRFIKDVIKSLQTSNSFKYYPYDWHSSPPITKQEIVINKGLCLERCYSFRFDLDWDLKIWVEAPKDICLKRGLARERLPKETVLKTWQEVWQPLEDEYIGNDQPASAADIVLDGTKPFDKQVG